MEKNKELRDWLNLLIRPGFYVEEGRITQVNAAAQGLLLEPGMDIAPLITSGLESYQNFQTGCLYVQLNLSGTTFQGCVTKDGSADVFTLESDNGDTALQALSLAARELRSPLSAVMHGVQAMREENNPQAAALNRGLYQLLRLVGNMSDAGRWPGNARMETADLTAFFDELFEKTAVFAQAAGIHLEHGLPLRAVHVPPGKRQHPGGSQADAGMYAALLQGGGLARRGRRAAFRGGSPVHGGGFYRGAPPLPSGRDRGRAARATMQYALRPVFARVWLWRGKTPRRPAPPCGRCAI